MSNMNVEIKYTYQDLLTTPDDRHRYEIFEGELIVTPSPIPIHQIAVSNLHRILSTFVETHNLGKVLVAPLDVYFDEETVVEPDILFIRKERLSIIDEQKVNGSPDVVIEVLSPSTESRDRGFKFKRYAQEGVKEYWIADPDSKTIELYHLSGNGFVLHQRYNRNDEVPSQYFSGLQFTVAEIWA